MGKRKTLAGIGAALAACALAGPSPSPAAVAEQGVVSEPVAAVPGEIVVTFRARATDAERAAVRRQAGVGAVRSLGAAGIQLVELRDGSTAEALAELRAAPDVLHASRNWLRRPSALPEDPLFGQLWGLHNTGQGIGQENPVFGIPDADVDAPEAWDVEPGWAAEGPATVVAVMDTGADLGHRDLATSLWINPGELSANGVDDDGNGYVDDVHGYDFAGEDIEDPLDRDADPDDPDGHGTHVSGTILAEGDDREGIVGVASRARLMTLKVCALDEEGEAACPFAAMIEAYAYARDNGAHVLNGSLGGPDFAPAEVPLLSGSPDTLFVFAAGNEATDNDDEPSYPCGLDELPGYTAENLLCVAATTPSDGLAASSNFGAGSVDLGAPGEEILSSYPEALVDTELFLPYAYLSGTSMAAPHVSGAAALLHLAAPATTPQQAKDAILASAEARPALIGKTVSGGRLNVRLALEELGLGEPPEPEGEGGQEGGTTPPLIPVAPDTIVPNPSSAPELPRGDRGPRAFFRKRPPPVIRTDSRWVLAVFGFASDEAGVAFVCAVDGRLAHSCGQRLARRFRIGSHVVRVRARDGAGNLGPAAAHRFQVKRDRG